MFVLVTQASANIMTLTEGWQVRLSETDNWIPATVPSTLMGVLTANGIEPETVPASCWYRTTFNLPALKKGEHVILNFDGISYRANVWLNGHQIANSQQMFGTFRQFEFDVTKQISQKNELTVEVLRAQPGEPNTGFVDWNPRPADESMGIFREVSLKTCGPVSLTHSAVRSRVNSKTLDEAWLTIATELTNYSDNVVSGKVKGTADGHPFECPVTLAAGEKRALTLAEEIHVEQPRLWWCHQMGQPERCDLHIEFVEDGKMSDSEDVRFGIREIRSDLTEEGYRRFTLNGQPVLLRGAGWTDDIYLRDTPETNRLQLEYVRDMNMNTVRLEGFWGTSQNLYDLCDELGLMILVGWSCHWEWEDYLGSPCDERFGGINTPEKIELIARSFEDQVMWLRYHPSIIGWFVGSDMLPKPELERQYLSFLKDNDDRDYIIKMAGPYEYVGPSYWYLPDAPGGAFGFNTETGIGAQLPVKESLEKMIGKQLFPIDNRWDPFCTVSASAMNSLKQLNEVIHYRFGDANDIDTYLRRADLLNYESTKAMFESFRARWPHTTGIIQWMLNGARYGVKKANASVQLIYDYDKHAVFAVNETLQPAELKASMQLIKKGTSTQNEKSIAVAPGTVVKVFDIDITDTPAAFLFLKLVDQEGQETHNEYFLVTEADTYDWTKTSWVNTPITHYASYTMLDEMCTRSCDVTVKETGSDYEVTVSNPSDKVAFMIRLTAKQNTRIT